MAALHASRLGYSLRSDPEAFLRLGHEIGLDTPHATVPSLKFFFYEGH